MSLNDLDRSRENLTEAVKVTQLLIAADLHEDFIAEECIAVASALLDTVGLMLNKTW